jgi:hypothetical protein
MVLIATGSRPVNLSTVTELTADSDGRQSNVSQWNVKHMWNNCRIQVFKQRLSMLHQTCFLSVAHSNLSVDRHAISWFDGCSHVLMLDAVRHAVAIAQHWWTPQLEGEETVAALIWRFFWVVRFVRWMVSILTPERMRFGISFKSLGLSTACSFNWTADVSTACQVFHCIEFTNP